jgi:hypothetical protein
MKAKEFWNILSVECDYRFFSGVVCPGLLPLYKKMNGEFMHYVPASNERIAFGMVCGASTAGFKSGLLMDMSFIKDIYTLLPFAINNKISFVIIAYGNNKISSDFNIINSKFKNDVSIRNFLKEIEHKSEPGVLIIGKDSLI